MNPREVVDVEHTLAAWLEREHAENDLVVGVGQEEDFWWMRIRGDDKDLSTIRFSVHQRTLRYETYVLPGPTGDPGPATTFLLRRNGDLHGLTYAIGDEDAVFLLGRAPVEWVDDDLLDRVLGSIWAEIERSFRTLVRLVFAPNPPPNRAE